MILVMRDCFFLKICEQVNSKLILIFFLLIPENDITREAWKKKVESALDHGHDLYPTYEKIVEYLQKHRPEAICLTANDCCVSMQVSVTLVVEFKGAVLDFHCYIIYIDSIFKISLATVWPRPI